MKHTRDGAAARTIAESLRHDIVSGRLAPGQRLGQAALAKRFDASRMPVREALQQLRREGLVDQPTNRSVVVAPLDPAAFREISEMRAALEPLALRLAIPELGDRQIDQAGMFQDIAERSGTDEFSQLNQDFHATLLTPCQRPRLLAQIADLNRMAARYLQAAAVRLGYFEQSHKEHRALLDACRARDDARATRLLQQHILTASAHLLETLGQPA